MEENQRVTSNHIVLAAVVAGLNLEVLNDGDQYRILTVGDLQIRADAERFLSNPEIRTD